MRQQNISRGHNPTSMKTSYVIDELGELMQAVECLRQLAGASDMQMIAYHLNLAFLEAEDLLASLDSGKKQSSEPAEIAAVSAGS